MLVQVAEAAGFSFLVLEIFEAIAYSAGWVVQHLHILQIRAFAIRGLQIGGVVVGVGVEILVGGGLPLASPIGRSPYILLLPI